MLNGNIFNLFKNSSVFLMFAILIGSFIGITFPTTGDALGHFIDPTILALVFLLLFEVPVKGIFKGLTNIKFIAVAWVVNFILIPLIGFAIASVFLSGNLLFYTGLVIYFMAPCTDWYLGFTRLAKGNVELGAALLPINMVSQLILFPVYLVLFDTVIQYKLDLSMLAEWFLQPLAAAALMRVFLRRYIDKLLPLCKALIPVFLSVLVMQIFASNVSILVNHLSVLPLLLSAIFTFFVITYALSELVSKTANFNYPDHCLLTFTTAARNAPLMLGLTTVAMPNQPLIYATIAIGMLIEFPHLAALKSILLRRRTHNPVSSIVSQQNNLP